MSVIIQSDREVIINGKRIDIPKKIGRFGTNSSIVNGKIFVNGWELKDDGTWKRTLRALWHLWF